MLNKSLLKSVLLVAGLASINANASLITNGSFEQAPAGTTVTFGGEQASLTFGDLAVQGKDKSWGVFSGLPGWSMISGYGPGIEVQYDGTLSSASGTIDNKAADGNHYLEMDTHFGYTTPGNSNAGIFQLLTGLNIGQTYELSFWYRARDTAADNNGLNVYWKTNGSVINKTNADFTYDYNAIENNNANWVNYKEKVIATSTEMLIGFGGAGEQIYNPTKNTTGGGNGKGALLDMVSLVAVPAPATIALFGLAGLALFSRRRKI
jgi:hypothetical protein